MEEYTDIKEHINNYDSLDVEEKKITLEEVYRKQMKAREIDRTLAEIIEKQMRTKNDKANG